MRTGDGKLIEGENFKDIYGIKFPRRENEGELHWKLKNFVYGFLKEKGYYNFKEEVVCGDYQIDLICISPDNKKIGIEIGDINIHPAIDLKKRFKKCSKFMDKIYWCPFSFYGFLRFSDVLMAEANLENKKDYVDGFMIRGKQLGWGAKYKLNLIGYDRGGFDNIITEFDLNIIFNTKSIHQEIKNSEIQSLFKQLQNKHNEAELIKHKIIKLTGNKYITTLKETNEK